MKIVMDRSKSGKKQSTNFTLKNRLISLYFDMNRICTGVNCLYTVYGFTLVQYWNALDGQPGYAFEIDLASSFKTDLLPWWHLEIQSVNPNHRMNNTGQSKQNQILLKLKQINKEQTQISNKTAL